MPEGRPESTMDSRRKKIQKKIVFSKNEVGKQVNSIENQAKYVISINWSRLHAMASMAAHELQNTSTEGAVDQEWPCPECSRWKFLWETAQSDVDFSLIGDSFSLTFHWFPMIFIGFGDIFCSKTNGYWTENYGFQWKTSTLTSCSSELRRSFGMSRHVFSIRIARSRDSRAPYSVGIAARNRKT